VKPTLKQKVDFKACEVLATVPWPHWAITSELNVIDTWHAMAWHAFALLCFLTLAEKSLDLDTYQQPRLYVTRRAAQASAQCISWDFQSSQCFVYVFQIMGAAAIRVRTRAA